MPTESRRDRHRRELVDELCDEARRLLAEGGAGAVTWRGLARAVGMSPASLYTYFDGLDDLFTELILRSYRSLAAATAAGVDAFADRPAGDRILAGPYAYRRWALAHRGEFNLVFTDQLPGYAAEPGGATVDAQTAVFAPMIRAARAAGAAPAEQDDPEPLPPGRVPDEVQRLMGVFGCFHGLTSLEVNHHLDWLDAPTTFDTQVRAAIAAAGLPAAGDDFAAEFARRVSAGAGATT